MTDTKVADSFKEAQDYVNATKRPDPPDLIAQFAHSPEQEASMRAVHDRVGSHIWQLLFIARNQNAQKLAAICNHGSLEARRCKQFVFAADVSLGIYAPPVTVPPTEESTAATE